MAAGSDDKGPHDAAAARAARTPTERLDERVEPSLGEADTLYAPPPAPRAQAPVTPGLEPTLDAAALEAPPSSAPTRARASVFAKPPAERYARRGELARGGMGRIVVARDLALDRTVALKELLAIEPRALARFEREARVTARLQHPSIVPLYEAGQGPDGAPYFVMKKVEGRSLDEAIAEKAGPRERLELLPHVLAVADAIAYAHTEGVLHRDLKPLNVLVGAFGETAVIDWGIARDQRDGAGLDDSTRLEPQRDTQGQLTVAGGVVGTPAYMAPEQAGGEPLDERSDVYALGAMLYQTLAGAPPYRGQSAWQVLSLVLSGPPVPLDEAAPEAPLELRAIVARAMARERDARYPNAGALADDLRRYLNGQLVGAHRYTAGELARRWLRRHRATVAVALAGLGLTALVGGASLVRVVRARDEAERAAARAQREERAASEARRAALASANRALLAQASDALERDPARTVALLRELSLEAPGWPAARMLAAAALAQGLPDASWNLGGAPQRAPVWSADGARVGVLRSDGTLVLVHASTGRRTLHALPPELRRNTGALGFRSDGALVLAGAQRRVAVVSPDGALTVQQGRDDDDDALARAVGSVEPHRRLVFRPTSLGWRDEATGAVRTLVEGALPTGVAVSRDGRWIVHELGERGLDGLATVRRRALFSEGEGGDGGDGGAREGPVFRVPSGVFALSPRGRWLVTHDGAVYDTTDGARVALRTVQGRAVFADDDRSFVVVPSAWPRATSYEAAALVRAGEREALRVEERAGALTPGAAVSPTGALLATPSDEGVLLLPGPAATAGAPLRRLLGHSRPASAFARFSPDGGALVTVGSEGVARRWSVEPPRGAVRAAPTAHLSLAPYTTSDGARLTLVALDDARVGLAREPAQGAAPREFALEGAPAPAELLLERQGALFDRAGRYAVLLEARGGAWAFSTESGARVGEPLREARVAAVLEGPARVLAAGARGLFVAPLEAGEHRAAREVALPGAEDAAVLEGCSQRASLAVLGLYGLHDGGALALFGCGPAGRAGEVQRWARLRFEGDATRWEPALREAGRTLVERHELVSVAPSSRAFRASVQRPRAQVVQSPDRRRVALREEGGAVRAWSVDEPASSVLGVRSEDALLGFSPDGARVLTAGPQELAVFSVGRGAISPLALAWPYGAVNAWSFSPASDRLLVLGGGHAVLFELETGEARELVSEGSAWSVGVGAWFAPDGASLGWSAGSASPYADRAFAASDALPREPFALAAALRALPFRASDAAQLTRAGLVLSR